MLNANSVFFGGFWPTKIYHPCSTLFMLSCYLFIYKTSCKNNFDNIWYNSMLSYIIFLLYFSFHVHEYLIHSLQLFNKTLQFFFFLQKIDLTPNSDNIQSNRMLAYLILITLFRISLFMFMNISFTSFLWTGIQMTRYGCRKNTEMRMVHRRFCEKIKQPPPLFRDCYLRECAQPM